MCREKDYLPSYAKCVRKSYSMPPRHRIPGEITVFKTIRVIMVLWMVTDI